MVQPSQGNGSEVAHYRNGIDPEDAPVPLVPNVADKGNGAQGFLGPKFADAVAQPAVTPTQALLLHGMPPASQKDFLYGRKGPWPQPSPSSPLGQAPAVVHLPFADQIDWQVHIGSRYLATLLFWWPVAAARTAAEPELA